MPIIDDWDVFPHRPPLPADGIKARTQRGKFGQTWWASRWLATLERICGESRLTRGRSYARRGQVISLEAGAGGVEARVQGSRRTPYEVSIRLRPLSDANWDRVIDAMATRALYAARLLAGEMPEQIEEVFIAVGSNLLPVTKRDLLTTCSCPDYANPCKHVAAVYYLLGERFDEDPFLMFELRGRPKDVLLAALRERRGDAAPVPPLPLGEAAHVSPLPMGEDQGEGTGGAVPLASVPAEDFWRSPAGLPSLQFSFDPPAVDALPVKRLGPPPFAPDSAEFSERMEQIYRIISDHARRLARGDE